MSDRTIMVRRAGEQWRSPDVSAYANEQGLQEIIAASPELLPGVSDTAATAMELYLDATGSLDVLCVDPDGSITVVECKLRANPEIRREVVGQILAYASALWQMSYDDLDARFTRRAGRALDDSIAAKGQPGSWDAAAFRSAVSTNLAGGAFRLVIVVDGVTDELKRIVEYLNTHTGSGVEVLGLELGYISDGDIEMLIPATHGTESARLKRAAAPKAGRQWSLDDVWTELERLCTPEGLAATRILYDDAVARGARVQLGSATYPSLSLYLPFNGGASRPVCAILADPSGPGAARVQLAFGSWRREMTDEEIASLLAAMEERPELVTPLAKVRSQEFNAYPTIPIDAALGKPGVVYALAEALAPHLPPRDAP